jgi:hypothetical protein
MARLVAVKSQCRGTPVRAPRKECCEAVSWRSLPLHMIKKPLGRTEKATQEGFDKQYSLPFAKVYTIDDSVVLRAH